MSRDEEILTRWRLETGQACASVDDLYKKIRREQTEEKKLETVRSELDKRTAKLTETTKAASFATQALAHATGSVLSTALLKAKQEVGALVEQGLLWEDWIGKNTAGLDGLSQSVGGMIDSLTIAKARSQLMNNEFGATERQLQGVLKAAVLYSRINKEELGPSLQKLIDGIREGGEGTVFRRLGLDVAFVGEKSAKTRQSLELLEKKYSDTRVEVENTNEAVAAAKSAWDDFSASAAASAVQVLRLKDAFSWLAQAVRGTSPFPEGGLQWPEMGKGKGGRMYPKGQHPWAGRRLEGMGDSWWGTDERPGPWEKSEIDVRGIYTPETKEKEKRAGGVPKGGIPKEWFTVRDDEKAPEYPGPPDWMVKEKNWSGAADGIALISEQWKTARIEADKAGAAFRQIAEKKRWDDFTTVATGALTTFTAGLWDAADQAIQSGESFGMVALKMLKAVTLGLASELTAMGITSLFKAQGAMAVPFTAPLGGSYAAQAGIYFAGAAAVGGLGLGLSAATAGSGAGAGSSVGGAPSSARDSGGAGQSFGRTNEEREVTVHVHLEIPSAKSGAAAWMTDQILTTRVTRA